MQDRPNQLELIEVVTQFITEELLPLTLNNSRLRFRTLIAANVLNIVSREMVEGEALLHQEWQRLIKLFDYSPPAEALPPAQLRQAIEDFNRELCTRLRTEDSFMQSEEWYESLTNHLEATVLEKLQIANPNFLQRELEARH